MHCIGAEPGVGTVVWRDARGRRFTVAIEPAGRLLEIGTVAGRPELVLDDGTAASLAGLLWDYRTARTLTGHGAADRRRDGLEAAVEDLAAQVETLKRQSDAMVECVTRLTLEPFRVGATG